MKLRISILLLSATIAFAAPPEALQRASLDERVVVTVPVSTNRVTTISFPGPITAIDAVGVTADGKTPGQFQLAHTKGSSFVSVRALARKVATNLNIRWNKRTYVFELIEGDAPGLLPPHAASTVYFAITGTPDGGRNELSLKNEFSVLVGRLASPANSAATGQTIEPSPSQLQPPSAGMTPEQEALARQSLRRAIEESQNTNAPSANPLHP